MHNNEKIKLTVIVRLRSGKAMSSRSVGLAVKEASAAGVPFDLVLWDANRTGDYAYLTGEEQSPGPRSDQHPGPHPDQHPGPHPDSQPGPYPEPHSVRLVEGDVDVSSIAGDYFCVLDDDDYWEDGSLAKLLAYLDSHADDTDIAFAYRRMAKAKRRPFAYRRIAKTPPEIVDIENQFERINTMYKGAVIRTDAVRPAVSALSNDDGSEVICTVAAALSRMRYALISSAVIRYTELRGYRRDRADETTARELFDTAHRLTGKVPRYVQSVALECVYFSLKRKKTDLSVLAEIAPEVIERSSVNRRAKEYLFGKKYGGDAMRRARFDGKGVVRIDGDRIADISKGEGIKVSVLDVRGGRLYVDGLIFSSAISSARLLLTNGKGDEGECEVLPHPPEDVETDWGEKIALGERYRVSVRLRKGSAYRFVLEGGDGVRVKLSPFMGAHSRLNDDASHSYFVKGGYRISFSKGALKVAAAGRAGNLKAEAKYLMEIAREGELGVVFYRALYTLCKAFKRRPVWLVGDRPQFAKDNAEHLFRYFMENGFAKGRDIYFVIDKASPDCERMKRIGRTLPFDTVAHRIKFLLSDKVILSTANDVGTNPFSKKRQYYQDLYSFDYVFLRHGVSHNDMSGWINKLNKNIRLLVSSAPREYEAILEGDYCYDESVVKLTGLPRYDNLTSAPQKLIVFLPTWRKNLQGKILPASPKRQYRGDFKTSEYFLFYNRLMNDERLLAAMRAGGYRGKFFLHPVFEPQVGDFTGNELFEIGLSVADYQQLFRESDLMLTDYSSVAFDFAYLKKPVIYAQFDFDSFYLNHSWGKSYFTYEDDSFGPIGHDYEETVELLLRYIEGGCTMTNEYKAKVDEFFAFTDKRNCERVASAIVGMDSGGGRGKAGGGDDGGGIIVRTNTATISGGNLVLDLSAPRGPAYEGVAVTYRHKVEADKLERVFPVGMGGAVVESAAWSRADKGGVNTGASVAGGTVSEISTADGGTVRLRFKIPLSDIPFRMTNWTVSLRAKVGAENADIPIPFKKRRRTGRLADFLSGGSAVIGNCIAFTYSRKGALGLRYRAKLPYDSAWFRVRELAALACVKLARKRLKKDKAIIIYERDHAKAQDNAWYLFKYCMENNMERKLKRRIYYAIDRKAPDCAKMKQWSGNVLDFPSFSFLVRALSASLLVSTESRMHDYFRYPARSIVAPRLAKKKSVFLQHGVLAFKRLNSSFDKRNLKSALVTCISDDEARIMREWHGFPDDRIAITGYARFDALEDRSEGRRDLMMMPTHRSWLFGVEESVFVSSEYYERYSELLKSPELKAVLESHDMNLSFIVHPSIAEHTRLFQTDSGRVRIVAPGEESIDAMMMRSKALITDYSSIAWDMYYMDKPTLFYQFDADMYDEAWGSYIDLKNDLPGPSAETKEEIITLIEACAKRNFAIEQKYENQRTQRFKHIDKNNCKRIIEEIARRKL
jgi:CDP-glycerol glycerophosphotransferase (TagB/SpsB family)